MATSLRRRSACSILLLAGAGLGAAVLWRGSGLPLTEAGSPAVRAWPRLRRSPGRGRPARARPGLALWLLITSLPPAVQGEALSLAELALDSLEARANPLAVDVSADDLQAETQRLLPSVLPSYNAAVHLAGWPWPVAGSPEVVTPVTGGAANDSSCPAWPGRPGDGAQGQRLTRFSAWSLAYGLLVDCGDARGVERLRAELAQAVARVASPPALLVDSRVQRIDPALVPQRRFVELTTRARRLAAGPGFGLATNDDPDPARERDEPWLGLVRGLLQGPPSAPALPWLELRESELFVAPKLGALARRQAFLAELERAARRAGVAFRLAKGDVEP